jgi:hypothetical protein
MTSIASSSDFVIEIPSRSLLLAIFRKILPRFVQTSMENELLGILIEKSVQKAKCSQRINHAAGTLFEIGIVVEKEQVFGILDSALLPRHL